MLFELGVVRRYLIELGAVRSLLRSIQRYSIEFVVVRRILGEMQGI